MSFVERYMGNTLSAKRRRDFWTYLILMLIPFLNFIIFYVVANINSIVMAFQTYDLEKGAFVWAAEDWLINFKNFIYDLQHLPQLQPIWKNSLILYLASWFISTPLLLFFSYYIYKKALLADTLKVIIFMPSIVSGICEVLMFRYFTDNGLLYIVNNFFGGNMETGLLGVEKYMFATLMFFGMWTGLGPSTLLYIGNMNQINESLFEAAQLDGAGEFRQFIHIIIPGVWPLWSVGIYTGITGIFFSGVDAFTFFNIAAPTSVYSLGYFLTIKLLQQGNTGYPYLSAVALLQTFVAIPLVYTARWLVEKYGPSDL